MTRFLGVACLQTRAAATPPDAMAQALALAEMAAAAGAELLCLPAGCDGRAGGAAAIPEEAHPLVASVRDLARRRGVWVLIGALARPAPDGRRLARGLLVESSGAVAGRDDTPLPGGIGGPARAGAGAAAALHDTFIGRIAQAHGRDASLETSRHAPARIGAEILVLSAATTRAADAPVWREIARARAIATGAFVLAPALHAPGAASGGGGARSLILDPRGNPLAEAGREPGVIAATLDLGLATGARGRAGEGARIGPDGPASRPAMALPRA